MMSAFGGSSPAIINVRGLGGALQYLQHGAYGALVGSDKLAIAFIGFAAVLKDDLQLFCLGKDLAAYLRSCGKLCQAVPVGAQLCPS